jgi:hypothetical protein
VLFESFSPIRLYYLVLLNESEDDLDDRSKIFKSSNVKRARRALTRNFAGLAWLVTVEHDVVKENEWRYSFVVVPPSELVMTTRGVDNNWIRLQQRHNGGTSNSERGRVLLVLARSSPSDRGEGSASTSIALYENCPFYFLSHIIIVIIVIFIVLFISRNLSSGSLITSQRCSDHMR